MLLVTRLVGHLTSHVGREEDGIFRALRETGEYVEEVDGLENEHRGLEAAIAGLEVTSPDFSAQVGLLLDDLDVHVQREEGSSQPRPSPWGRRAGTQSTRPICGRPFCWTSVGSPIHVSRKSSCRKSH